MYLLTVLNIKANKMENLVAGHISSKTYITAIFIMECMISKPVKIMRQKFNK